MPGSSGLIERILAHAAIAYGLGFVVVMLHTARLGFPVIVLLDPIYVWIGLPLAVIVFFGAQVVALIRTEVRGARENLMTALQTLPDRPGMTAQLAAKELASLYGLTFSLPPMRRVAERVASLNLDHYVRSAPDPEDAAAVLKNTLRALERPVMIMSAITRALNALSYALFLAGGLVVYVWTLYPQIPQAYGGGAPVSVCLVVDRTRFPIALLSDIAADTGRTHTLQSNATITDTIPLLYTTDHNYYVRGRSARPIAVARSGVVAVIWPSEQPGCVARPN